MEGKILESTVLNDKLLKLFLFLVVENLIIFFISSFFSNIALANGITIEVSGTANEVEVISGSFTLDGNHTITLGLPDDVTIANDLTVEGVVYANGGFKAPVFAAADIPADYTANPADYAGHMFYLSGSGNADFAQGNKWYFNENGEWHASFFFAE